MHSIEIDPDLHGGHDFLNLHITRDISDLTEMFEMSSWFSVRVKKICKKTNAQSA